MIIRSKYIDYYDFVAGLYRDNKVIFNREKKEGVSIPKYLNSAPLLGGRSNKKEVEHGVVVFCGNPYYYYEVRIYDMFLREKTCFVVYQHNHPNQYENIRKEVEEWKRKELGVKCLYVSRDKVTPDFKRGASELGLIYSIRQSFWGAHTRTLTVYPRLKDLRFPLDPHLVFQELSMNMVSQDPEIVQVADKYKLTAHGFDDKSFKTRPGTRPNRKKK